MEANYEPGTFGYDLEFLSHYDTLHILSSPDGMAQVIVSPKYQGKVFTSTTNGSEGISLGYINHDFFVKGVVDEHMNGFGGENRLWLGPEGGQFSLFFSPGAEQVYDNWHTPAPVDTEPWTTQSADSTTISMVKEMQLPNYLGSTLHTRVERRITLLSPEQLRDSLGCPLPESVRMVAYRSENRVTNLNDFAWTPETGTLSIWILDMFKPSEEAVTIIPHRHALLSDNEPVATTNYFGEIPPERLSIQDRTLYLKTDGKYRSKVGLSALRTTGIAGNYDPLSNHLIIVTFDVAPNRPYINQEWDPTKDPLKGETLHAYNDGPLEDGSIMGPFLELESSSPAALLAPGESLSHRHNVYHFVGKESDLSLISQQLLGVSLEQVQSIFRE